jgi:hypothetical protein
MSLLVLLCLGVATPALSGWAVPLESAAKVRTFAGMCGLSSCFSCSAGADFFGEPGDVSSCSHGHPPQAQLPSPKICSLQPIFQIAPGQREQLGKDAAASAQKVCFAWALGALCCSFVSKQLQAYAPTQNKVQAFLSSEVHAEHACPACDNKDYSDGSVAQSVSTNADSYRVVCLFFARCPDGWDAADGRCLLREASSRAHPLLLPAFAEVHSPSGLFRWACGGSWPWRNWGGAGPRYDLGVALPFCIHAWRTAVPPPRLARPSGGCMGFGAGCHWTGVCDKVQVFDGSSGVLARLVGGVVAHVCAVICVKSQRKWS